MANSDALTSERSYDDDGEDPGYSGGGSASYDEDDDEDGKRSDDDPYGVTARVAGLRAARDVASGGGAVGDAVDGAVDGFDVDYFPENVCRKSEERLDDGGSVGFVDVILVVERVVDGLERFGDFGGLAGLAEVEPEGGEQADERGEDGDDCEDPFQVLRRRFGHTFSFMCSAEDRQEEVREMICASWEERGRGEPAACETKSCPAV